MTTAKKNVKNYFTGDMEKGNMAKGITVIWVKRNIKIEILHDLVDICNQSILYEVGLNEI